MAQCNVRFIVDGVYISNRDVEVSEIDGPRVYHRQSVQN